MDSINGPDDENSEPKETTKSPFYVAVFSDGNSRSISAALDKASNIKAWVKLGAPPNAYTIKTDKQTTPGHIRDLFKKASDPNVLVMEVNMKNHAWWLTKDNSAFFDKWIKKYLD